MATIVTKFSDYVIHSIEYFISALETELGYRDLPGLTNNKIEIINITKQHPIANLMSAQILSTREIDDLRSSIIPAISVTPGNMDEGGFTLGQCYKSETVDDDFIDELKTYLAKTDKEIQDDMLISKTQIETIIGEYNRTETGGMRVQRNEWNKNEETNISIWSDNADIDILLGNLIDSILATIQVGFVGDNSKLRNFKYRTNKGLTNFNFGRVLFGSEYILTFLNSFDNYIIYTDTKLSGHDFYGTFEIPGD